MTIIDANTKRRLTDAVRWVERQSVGSRRNGRYASQVQSIVPRLFVASADIEHGATGEGKPLKGASVLSPATGDDVIKLLNLGPKVFSGAVVLAVWASWELPGDVEPESWQIVQAWSCTRIRGETVDAIEAGSSGSVNVTRKIDGHLTASTVTVHLPTEFVAVAASRVIWAELVWTGTESRWEAYSADCDGGTA